MAGAVRRAARRSLSLEGTTGWRFVVEEIERAGHRAHLADPAETAARRGRKRRAKTDNADCDLQLRLLLAGELPESWIPPAQILELRTRVRLRKTLIDQRTAWQQRLHAQLFHQGVPAGLEAADRRRPGSARACSSCRRPDASSSRSALRMLDTLDVELAPIDRALRAFARRQPGCRALIEQLYGVGPVSATAILAELGDCRRFSRSDDAVRHCRPRRHRLPVRRQARRRPPLARGARRCCAGRCSRPPSAPPGRASPDHAYYLQVAEPDRPQPRLPLGRPQALPARPPHPARARRRRTRPDRATSRRRRRRSQLPPDHARTRARRPSSHRCSAAGSRRPPAASADQPGRPRETERPQATPAGDNTRSIILSPDPPVRAPR